VLPAEPTWVCCSISRTSPARRRWNASRVVDPGVRLQEGGQRLDLRRLCETGDARGVVVGAEDAEHGGAVLLGPEGGVEPPRGEDRRGEPAVAELLVGAAPLVLDVGDPHARAGRAVGDPEPEAVVLEGRQIRRGGRGVERRPAAGRILAADGRGRRRGRDHGLDAGTGVEAAREAVGGGRTGGLEPVEAPQLGDPPSRAALEPVERGRGQRRARGRAERVGLGRRGGDQHRGRWSRRRDGRRDRQRHRRGGDEAASEHPTRMASRTGGANRVGVAR
jgi:hypothetical protein